MSLLKHAFGPLFGVMPLSALTGRNNDPSAHTDFLARTQGMSLCSINEPDSGTQQLYPDVLKTLSSDTDSVSVREIYGTARDMMITFARGPVPTAPRPQDLHAVQHPARVRRPGGRRPGVDPQRTNVDAAIIARSQYVPFESTFSDHAPERTEHQFQEVHFRADRQFNQDRYVTLSPVLMYMFYCRYMERNMNDSLFALTVPPRIRMESEMHLYDVQAFRPDPRRVPGGRAPETGARPSCAPPPCWVSIRCRGPCTRT